MDVGGGSGGGGGDQDRDLAAGEIGLANFTRTTLGSLPLLLLRSRGAESSAEGAASVSVPRVMVAGLASSVDLAPFLLRHVPQACISIVDVARQHGGDQAGALGGQDNVEGDETTALAIRLMGLDPAATCRG